MGCYGLESRARFRGQDQPLPACLGAGKCGQGALRVHAMYVVMSITTNSAKRLRLALLFRHGRGKVLGVRHLLGLKCDVRAVLQRVTISLGCAFGSAATVCMCRRPISMIWILGAARLKCITCNEPLPI